MLRTNQEFDPVVEILRLAYRRGLAIQREQEEKSGEIGLGSSQDDLLSIEREPRQTITQKD